MSRSHLKLNIIPALHREEIALAAVQYKNIWGSVGVQIATSIEHYFDRTFVEAEVPTVIYEGPSHSGSFPGDIMKLRASYEVEQKQAALVHELCHRIMFGVRHDGDNHELIFCFLYDIWLDLFGLDFAQRAVKYEQRLGGLYAAAWSRILSLSKDERSRLFEKLVSPADA